MTWISFICVCVCVWITVCEMLQLNLRVFLFKWFMRFLSIIKHLSQTNGISVLCSVGPRLKPRLRHWKKFLRMFLSGFFLLMSYGQVMLGIKYNMYSSYHTFILVSNLIMYFERKRTEVTIFKTTSTMEHKNFYRRLCWCIIQSKSLANRKKVYAKEW